MSWRCHLKRRQTFVLLVFLPALFTGAGANSAQPDQQTPIPGRAERRQRAERLQPRLGSLEDQFESRTFAPEAGDSIPYRLFKPRDYDPSREYPLVVYLHGAGGRGTDNVKQISGGNTYGARVWALAENQAERPCFILAPQLMHGISSGGKMSARGEKQSEGDALAGRWRQSGKSPARELAMELTLETEGGELGGSLRVPRRGTMELVDVSYQDGTLTYTTSGPLALKAELEVEGRQFTGSLVRARAKEMGANVKALIQATLDQYSIDQSRIYITGQSMGGSGTWGMLALYPHLFAAAVPLCGAGDVDSARAIVENQVAVWALHGAIDPTVSVEASRRMIAAVKEAGGRPKYTEFPDVKHDCWLDAYPDPQLHQWLFNQRRR